MVGFEWNAKENHYSRESVGLIVARRPRGVLGALSQGGGVPQVKNGGRGCWNQKILRGVPIPRPTLPKGVHLGCTPLAPVWTVKTFWIASNLTCISFSMLIPPHTKMGLGGHPSHRKLQGGAPTNNLNLPGWTDLQNQQILTKLGRNWTKIVENWTKWGQIMQFFGKNCAV